MLVDGFLFNNEFEVLTLRLATLSTLVSRFVLVEAAKTFSGQDKPLHYLAHKHRLGKWQERITHIVLDRDPLGPIDGYMVREGWQRKQIARGLMGLPDDARVLIGDVDEIPNPNLLAAAEPTCTFRQTLYYYDAHTRCTSRHWLGTVLTTAAEVRQKGAESIRRLRADIPAAPGGWHFSHTGGVQIIHEKLKAGSHREHDTPAAHAGIAERVAAGSDLFGREEFVFERNGLARDLPVPLLREPGRWPGLTEGRWQ